MLETLQHGCFVFEYGGEVVTNAELLRRGAGKEHAPVLDAHWQSELTKRDDILLSMDASRYSNVARWLNHRKSVKFLSVFCFSGIVLAKHMS